MNRGTDVNDSNGDLLAEVEALRAENDRLRGLLGLDERRDDGHVHAWAPTLLTEATGQPAVDASSTDADKLALLWSLFGARSDVYARWWESASSGKSGWSPATKDRWVKGRPPRSYLPLTDEVFISHLRGDETIGIYPLLRGDTCALLVCDFDKGTWALDALAYLDACHRNAVPAALERSRSGNGAHVWIFFDAPVAASTARAMGAALLRQAMTARAELDLSSYDRFFLSQDFMPSRVREPDCAPVARRLCGDGYDVVPRPHNDGAMARPMGVLVIDRAHDP